MALDFSSTQFFYYPIGSMVYKGLKTDLKKQSKEDLQSIDKNLKPLKKLDTRIKEAQDGMIDIYFRDPITQNITNSALSSKSIEKLKNTFGSADFYQRNNNSYILSGDTEKFVSSWYGDIAYQRGYLAADANNDGYLDEKELDETRSGFTSHGWGHLNGNKVVKDVSSYVESYIKLNGIATAPDGKLEKFKEAQKTFYNQGKFASPTLALELDKTLQNDKNFDGVITYDEILTQREMKRQSMDILSYVVENFPLNKNKDGVFVELSQLPTTLLDLLLKGDKEGKDPFEIFTKLSENDFDTKSLSKEELQTLKKDFKEFFNEKGELDKEKFKKYYEKLKKQFVNKSLHFLGLSKEDYQKGTLNLDFNKLSEVIKDIKKTFKEANTTPSNYSGLDLNLSV